MFTFSITAEQHYREGYLEIRMRFKFSDEDKYSFLSEIVPRERFISDKDFSKRVLDDLFHKARQQAGVKLKVLE